MENRQSVIGVHSQREKARLTLLLDPGFKRLFEAACAAQDLNCSQVVRHLIEAYVRQHAPPRRKARPARAPGR